MFDLSKAESPEQRSTWARENLHETARELRATFNELKNVLTEDTFASLQIALNNAEGEAGR